MFLSTLQLLASELLPFSWLVLSERKCWLSNISWNTDEAVYSIHSHIRSTVMATASTKEKLDWLLSIPNGATHVANYRKQDFAEEVKNATDGKGADVVVDFVGQSHFMKNLDSMAVDGRMTILALLSGRLSPSLRICLV